MKERIIKYRGKNIIIYFHIDRCTHYAACLMQAPEVFNTMRKPWVEPDAASAKKIARVIEECPTGALHYKRLDGGPEEAVLNDNTVTISSNGPVYLRGDIEVYNQENELLYKDTRLALCRCGKSKNMPLCDNSHMIRGFLDKGRVSRTPGRAEKLSKGVLKVKVNENGPYLLTGPMIIKDGSGNKAFQTEKALLCSCGLSEDKPFCDGKHVNIKKSVTD